MSQILAILTVPFCCQGYCCVSILSCQPTAYWLFSSQWEVKGWESDRTPFFFSANAPLMQIKWGLILEWFDIFSKESKVWPDLLIIIHYLLYMSSIRKVHHNYCFYRLSLKNSFCVRRQQMESVGLFVLLSLITNEKCDVIAQKTGPKCGGGEQCTFSI